MSDNYESYNYSGSSLKSLVIAERIHDEKKKKETNTVYQRKYPTSALEFLDFFLRTYERARIHVCNYRVLFRKLIANVHSISLWYFINFKL